MDETSKSKNFWGPLEKSILTGRGIDIGCGPDPITPEARRFDLEDGDANHISQYVHEQFDFVYSSHCLEHMHNPQDALLDWWKLVKPGGHLFFTVPDEDLYEQGVFPSRFNGDHKATFTISKARSWSPVSFNVLALSQSLPQGQLVSLTLQDFGYDRRRMRHGEIAEPAGIPKLILDFYNNLRRRGLWRSSVTLDFLQENYVTEDQTKRPTVLAQIQCIVRKLG
jgi:SAM-dependent methyltransferase